VDSPESVIPPPNSATPLEKRELETWPEASRMPRIAKVSPGAASPEAIICCTRAWFAFRIACSSEYALKAVICCGKWAPVLRWTMCAI
jgi:hypothetical protein